MFLDRLNDLFTFLLLFERRFDPFFRPTFDATLRDPMAKFTTALINMKRRNERLRLAEEKPMPDEEKYLDSIVSSFTNQMNLLWKPGAFERGGNTKTHGIVRGEFIVHDGLPRNSGAASSRSPRRTPRGCGFRDLALTSRPISKMWAS